MLQPGNTEELTRAAAKAISSVLGRISSWISIYYTPWWPRKLPYLRKVVQKRQQKI
jgi:hypothetical protein